MSTTPTTVAVAQNATQSDTLDLFNTQLLGLFVDGDSPRAMLRGGDGSIVMAAADDSTPLGDVVAITDTYVLLRQNRTVHRLTIPT